MAIPRKALVLKRPAAGTRVDGHWVEGTRTSSNIRASVQPLRPEEMSLLPEGRRNSEAFRLYTATRLQAAKESTGVNADYVVIDGADYEVMSCVRWQNKVIPHYKAICAKVIL
jgi:hypothetical protein